MTLVSHAIRFTPYRKLGVPVSIVDDGYRAVPVGSLRWPDWPSRRREIAVGHSAKLSARLFVRVFLLLFCLFFCSATSNSDILFNMMKEVTLRKEEKKKVEEEEEEKKKKRKEEEEEKKKK